MAISTRSLLEAGRRYQHASVCPRHHGNGDGVVIAAVYSLAAGACNDRVSIVRGLGPEIPLLRVWRMPWPIPTLDLRDQDGALHVTNDNWQDDPVQRGEINEAGLAPSDPLEVRHLRDTSAWRFTPPCSTA